MSNNNRFVCSHIMHPLFVVSAVASERDIRFDSIFWKTQAKFKDGEKRWGRSADPFQGYSNLKGPEVNIFNSLPKFTALVFFHQKIDLEVEEKLHVLKFATGFSLGLEKVTS